MPIGRVSDEVGPAAKKPTVLLVAVGVLAEVEEVVDELETVVEVDELVCVVAGVGVVGVSVVAGV